MGHNYLTIASTHAHTHTLQVVNSRIACIFICIVYLLECLRPDATSYTSVRQRRSQLCAGEAPRCTVPRLRLLCTHIFPGSGRRGTLWHVMMMMTTRTTTACRRPRPVLFVPHTLRTHAHTRTHRDRNISGKYCVYDINAIPERSRGSII